MKKLFLAMLIAFVSIGAFAQENKVSVGAQLSYGSDHERVGLGIKGQYGLIDNIRLEAAFNYFFKQDNISLYDLNVNVHYVIPITEQFSVYPLAGLTYMKASASVKEEGLKYSVSNSKLGANLGVGAQYQLDSNWAIAGELKYQIIKDMSQLVPSIGVVYTF